MGCGNLDVSGNKEEMKPLAIVLAIILSVAGSYIDHQDRILELTADGSIKGLPDQYSPASLDLKTQTFQIAENHVKFPRCMMYYYNSLDRPVVSLSASWYHSTDILPYYINYEIREKRQDYGYQIILNLETLEIIELNVKTYHDDLFRIHRTQLDKWCASDYLKAINAATKQ